MGLRYEEVGKLAHGHDKGITKVAFSPGGRCIATAGLDGKVCIWDIASQRLLHIFDGSCVILSLLWLPPHEDTILCGLQDGNLAVLSISRKNITITGFWAHAYPIECLALRPNDNLIASGAHREVLIWLWDRKVSKLSLRLSVGEPAKNEWNEASEVIVTSLHWTATAKCSSALLVTYMFHGVMLVDTEDCSRIRTIAPNCIIPSASLSDDGRRLAVSNGTRGFDVYSMGSGASLGTIDQPNGAALPTPVLFIHGSLALLGGSTTGALNVWDVIDTVSGDPALNVPESEERQPPVMHTLELPRRAKALAIAAYYAEDADEFFIAAGTMNESSSSSCVVWKATERGRAGWYAVAYPRIIRFSKFVGILAIIGAMFAAYTYGLLEDVVHALEVSSPTAAPEFSGLAAERIWEPAAKQVWEPVVEQASDPVAELVSVSIAEEVSGPVAEWVLVVEE